MGWGRGGQKSPCRLVGFADNADGKMVAAAVFAEVKTVKMAFDTKVNTLKIFALKSVVAYNEGIALLILFESLGIGVVP